jgi:flagellar hook-length control protein FliK
MHAPPPTTRDLAPDTTMTLASTAALSSMTAVAPPAASAAGPASPADDGGFARALQQARQGRRDGSSSDKPAGPPPKSNGAAQGAQDTQDAETAAATETAGRPEENPRTSDDTDPAAGTASGHADKAAADVPSAESGSLPPWMTAKLPSAPAESLPDAGDGTLPGAGEPGAAAQAGTGPARPASLGADPADDPARGAGLDAARRSGSDDRRAADDADGSRADDAGPAFRDTLVSASSGTSPAATPTALAAGGIGAHGGASGTPAPVAEHTLRPPLHSPAFAPALGAQLTLMVKEGVTEARLHLNPAEMGPISVQIQVEGGHARVEMAAEMAATRQVLEQSMPALAGALRESGLTLTGGGVFEQSARQGQPGDAERRPGGQPGAGRSGTGEAAGGAAEAGAGARPVGLPRGVVDVYA